MRISDWSSDVCSSGWGEYGGAPVSVRTLSQAVSYADLDLSKEAGRDMLRHRVSLTARFLCDKLGETNTSSPIVASCRDAATKDAMSRVETLEASSAPRGTTWVRPSPWDAPYPDDWRWEEKTSRLNSSH